MNEKGRVKFEYGSAKGEINGMSQQATDIFAYGILGIGGMATIATIAHLLNTGKDEKESNVPYRLTSDDLQAALERRGYQLLGDD